MANYFLFIPAIIIVGAQLFFHWFLHTLRHVKRLEVLGTYDTLNITKIFTNFSPAACNPLFSHISSTIQGLSTIRSYGEEARFSTSFYSYQDEHTKGWHMYIASNRWFGMRIDLISAIFLAFVVYSAIPLADSEYTKSYHFI